ncbi:MAG: DUF5054 domain-containing protein [Candidatus Fimenecus sp.]
MKKVIVVSKTHLDLGFTDYAENIRQKYINTFIPSAIQLAESINTETDKKFIWTTGSWILKEALRDGTQAQKVALTKALKDGNIVPHALPFTTHTELLDAETLSYGLSIVDELDATRGKKTVSAKMTDVPGHTAAIVPLLAAHGIKLLHIGVNGASAVPEVPKCFLWKVGGAEVVVVYSGDYGGAYKSEFAEEVLYFDHTLDNHGAPAPEAVQKKLAEIQKEYPDYMVSAGTLDEFAEAIWAVKDKLPILTGEIGDTWIHGSAADPYKSAALRTLMRLKREWLQDGTMERDTDEYKGFSDGLLCVAEHTCGMDSKISFADYENYLKADFKTAREKDDVTAKHIFRDFPHGIVAAFNRRFNSNQKKGSYRVIEKSWAEQRAYIDKAVSSLSDAHKEIALKALDALRPESLPTAESAGKYTKPVSFGGYMLSLNEHGGIEHFTHNDTEIIKQNNEPILQYHSYNKSDYDFWFTHYARNMKANGGWAYPDFGRPLLKYAEGKYPTGRFFYKMTDSAVCETADGVKIFVTLQCDKKLCEELGAPRNVQIVYTLSADGLCFSLLWTGKDANRLTEAIFLHLVPAATGDNFRLQKLGTEIDYRTVASMGGRNLHAVEKSILRTADGKYDFVSLHAPLISVGKGKILEYDNKIKDVEKDGISYVLCDNVWGTNFPLWYEDNAKFDFVITPAKEETK